MADRGQDAPGGYAETIFALATAPGRAALAVIRISGPAAHRALQAMAGRLPRERLMALRLLRATSGEPIDQALVVRFDEGRSFTGEDLVELHVHGGRATVARLLRELSLIDGLRLAEPGEFARRAFLAGKLDLPQAESLIDLIDAETEKQRLQALALLQGELSRQVSSWRRRLVDMLAAMESSLDFSDEGDVPHDVAAELRPSLAELADELAALSATRDYGRSLRDGFTVAIMGPPNAGKSTLLNRIAGEEAAIVSPVAGTTRDLIRIRMEIAGFPVWFVDMAGIRETEDEIESIGVRRAAEAASSADLRLVVEAPDARWADAAPAASDRDVKVWLKADLGDGPGDVVVSVRDGTGLDRLFEMIALRLTGQSQASGLVATERQAAQLATASDALRAAAGEAEIEICVEHVRGAVRALDLLVGGVDAEQVLDEVFSRFCIGK